MSLVPRSSLFDFDSFFDRFQTPGLVSENSGNFFTPRVDVREKDHLYIITAELPGVKKEDIHISLERGVLTLEAESVMEDREEKDGRVLRQERRYGRFTRSFTLGDRVQQSDISANFDNGILTLTAPKIGPQEAESRRIEIT